MEELTNQSEQITQEQTETTQESTETTTTEQTTQQEETTQEPDFSPLLDAISQKAKYNKQPAKVESVDQLVEAYQKGLNYDKAVERAKQEARDAYIAEQGFTWNGKPITTEAEYAQALREKEIYDSLQDKDLPDEVVNELLESRRDREERAREKQILAEQKRQEEDWKAFASAYPEIKAEDIPDSVVVEVAQGKSLVDAYARYENKVLKTKLQELTKGKQVAEVNAVNASTSPGSVNGNGQPTGAITEADIAAHANDTAWMMKNYEQVEKLLSKKKG